MRIISLLSARDSEVWAYGEADAAGLRQALLLFYL